MPASNRRPGSLPMPKSNSRNSCDINSRNDISEHPGHPHRCRRDRAKSTDSICRVLRTGWHTFAGSSQRCPAIGAALCACLWARRAIPRTRGWLRRFRHGSRRSSRPSPRRATTPAPAVRAAAAQSPTRPVRTATSRAGGRSPRSCLHPCRRDRSIDCRLRVMRVQGTVRHAL